MMRTTTFAGFDLDAASDSAAAVLGGADACGFAFDDDEDVAVEHGPQDALDDEDDDEDDDEIIEDDEDEDDEDEGDFDDDADVDDEDD